MQPFGFPGNANNGFINSFSQCSNSESSIGQSGSLKGFEEALGGGGGADVEIDIIAEQLIASSFHLCAVHHFLGHYNSFFF